MKNEYFKHNEIYLRPIEPEDLDALFRWENDTRLWDIGSTVSPYSSYTLKRYIEEAHADIYTTRQLRMIVVENETNQPVGTIDLYEFDPLNHRAGIGVLIDENYRNKGYGAQAIDAIESYAFNHLSVHQLYAHIPETNEASLALFQGALYEQTGVLKEWIHINRKYVDVVVMQKFHR